MHIAKKEARLSAGLSLNHASGTSAVIVVITAATI
jgi:hypothetical protein